jgi:hypothetical protein
MKKTQFDKEHLESVKNSYFNILALFLGKQQIESRFLRCLLKWGFQLHLSPDDLAKANIDLTSLQYAPDKIANTEAVYHLVYMIYLDEVVEDIELEVATIYAERLGLKADVVSELFKSIATEDYDGQKPRNVRQEVIDFLKLHEA